MLANASSSQADKAFALATTADTRAEGPAGPAGPEGPAGPAGNAGQGIMSIQCAHYSDTLSASNDKVEQIINGTLTYGSMNWTEKVGAVREYHINGQYANNGTGSCSYDFYLKRGQNVDLKITMTLSSTLNSLPLSYSLRILQNNTPIKMKYEYSVSSSTSNVSGRGEKGAPGNSPIGINADHVLTLQATSDSGIGSIVTVENFHIINIYDPQ